MDDRPAKTRSGKTSAPRRHEPKKTMLVGWREHVSLPELGLIDIPAKIDTGARSSALHAERVGTFERAGQSWVRFHVPHHRLVHACDCEAPLIGHREVKNTSGSPEARHVIETLLVIGKRRWHIEVTLADRTTMAMPLILGRTAIRRRRVLVDPGRSFLAGPPHETSSKRASRRRLEPGKETR